MGQSIFQGNVHKYGANIDTDQIIPARYLISTDESFLAAHAMEGSTDTEFLNRVQPGDIVVADTNFGCGSSREHAPIALKGAGISCIVAKSFARIFFRNSINRGIPVLECPEAVDATDAGDKLQVDLVAGTITNLTKEQTFQAKPLDQFMLDIIDAGGVIEYTKARLQSQGV
jgi:3-isopropylmalate/(R)-2-methylmalate dehydratase small subunit